jgi:hypothetical protein
MVVKLINIVGTLDFKSNYGDRKEEVKKDSEAS